MLYTELPSCEDRNWTEVNPNPNKIDFSIGKWPDAIIIGDMEQDWKMLHEQMQAASFTCEMDLTEQTPFIPFMNHKRPGDELEYELFQMIALSSKIYQNNQGMKYDIFIKPDPYQGCYGNDYESYDYYLRFNVVGTELRHFLYSDKNISEIYETRQKYSGLPYIVQGTENIKKPYILRH